MVTALAHLHVRHLARRIDGFDSAFFFRLPFLKLSYSRREADSHQSDRKKIVLVSINFF
jgi:hypothetical protein